MSEVKLNMPHTDISFENVYLPGGNKFLSGVVRLKTVRV
jgi:hypothetical protein